MASSSTQTFELETQVPPSEDSSTPKTSPEATFNFDPTNPDTVIAASLLADSQVPDGGYGWVVIFACSVLCFWFVGTTYSWGVIQAALVSQNLSSPSTLSFVGSLTCSCISFLALVNARVIRKIGCRNTALVGVILLGSGEVLSGWSTENVGALFFTAGVVMGVGAR